MIDLDNLMSSAEVATLLRVPESRLARWRTKGVGPSYVKIERQVLYPHDLLVEFLNESMILKREAEILTRPEYE